MTLISNFNKINSVVNEEFKRCKKASSKNLSKKASGIICIPAYMIYSL